MTTTMIDTIHDDVAHIPTSAPKIAGYLTGTPDIQWTPADWGRFPHSGHVAIDQSPGLALFAAGKADVADIEALAGTPAAFVAAVKQRIAAGITWSTVYGSDGVLKAVRGALVVAEVPYGQGWYFGHVNCWLADWNLSERAAALLLSTKVHGMTCVAVQWASPTSNPNTLVPGGSATLKQANVDLSVTSDAWFPPPVPPAPPALHGWVVPDLLPPVNPSLSPRRVSSTDGGKTWR